MATWYNEFIEKFLVLRPVMILYKLVTVVPGVVKNIMGSCGSSALTYPYLRHPAGVQASL